MICTASIDHHAMQSTSLFYDLFDRRGDRLFLGDIGDDSVELAIESLRHRMKLFARFCHVNGVHCACAIHQAALGNSKTYPSIGSGD